MLPSAAELHYFLEVAATLNLSRAADRLGVSQPALSTAMQRLEANVGAALLVRHKGGVRLTRAGQRLVARARDLATAWDELRDSARGDEVRVRGRYVLGCHPSVALGLLPGALPRLLREQPELELVLHHDLSRRVTDEVVAFRADFAVAVNPTRHPELVVVPLGRDRVSLWVADRRRAPLDLLLCDPALVQTQSILRALERHGTTYARRVESADLELLARLVAGGAGVGILPESVARRAGAMRLLARDAPHYDDHICLVYRADAQGSPAGRALARRLRELLTA